MAPAVVEGISWKVETGHLVANVDFLGGFAADGTLLAAQHANEIWLDVGVSGVPQPPPGRSFSALDNGTFYLGFEPVLDKYALNLARGIDWSPTNYRTLPLGLMQPPGVRTRKMAAILPLAVTDNDNKPADFYLPSGTDGCSSLLKPKPKAALVAGGWAHSLASSDCALSEEDIQSAKRTVPTVTLDAILMTWLGGRRVSHLKVDVQGAELFVLRSAGRYLGQIDELKLEVTSDRCTPLTEGAPSCEETLQYARQMGFEPWLAVSGSHFRYKIPHGARVLISRYIAPTANVRAISSSITTRHVPCGGRKCNDL